MLTAVLTTAAHAGGQDLFDKLNAALHQSRSPQERRTLLATLGAFRNPKILSQSQALLLDPAVDMREALPLFFGPLTDRSTERAPFEFVKAHYDAVVARMPSAAGSDYRAFLPFVGGSFCDEPSRREFVDFFQDRVKQYTGGPHNYAQELEVIRLCEAHREAEGADLAAFFSQQ